MSVRTTVLLFSFVVLSLTADLYTGSGTVALDRDFNATLGPFNVHFTATLEVSHTLPVSVCIVSAAYGLPHYTQYNEDNCLYYYNSTTSPLSQAVPLRFITYKMGIYLSGEIKKDDNTTVDVKLVGDDCAETGYWDGSSCSPAGIITGWSQPFHHTFKPSETKYWTFNAPNYVGNFKLGFVSSNEAVSAETTEMWARFSGVPSAVAYDAKDTNGNLTFTSPRPGTWVFGIHSANGGAASFQLTGTVCGSNSGGIGCMIPVANITNNASLVLKPTDSYYYRVVAHPGYPLIVSITTANASNIPYLYASKGVIPSNGKDNADVPNCNGQYCDVVRSISFNVTSEEEWYIGVFPSIDNGNTTFGIWWNSTCVVGCITDNHGQCLPDGRCECEIDFEGIDCSISKGLGPQYIVLIIIASLVVASAIIGFVAWAYMRRKRAAYEIVS